jgi:predicted metalloprotease
VATGVGEGGCVVAAGVAGGGDGLGVGGTGVAVAVLVAVAMGVAIVSGVGKAVLVGSDRMETPAASSPGLAPAEQAARRRTAAASAAIAPVRSIAMSSRSYCKGSQAASLI